MIRALIPCLLLLALWAAPAQAGQADDETLGKHLVQAIFSDLQDGRVEDVVARLAPCFQSVHQDGTRLRDDQAHLLRTLSVGEFELGDFTVTRHGDTLLVSYSVAVAETIDAARLSRTKAFRLSVFVNSDQGWLWAGHANLRPLSH